MKSSLFKGLLFGLFGLAALIGIFVFATHTSKTTTSATAVGSVVIWGTLPKANIQNVLMAATQVNTLLKDVTYIQKDENTLPADLASAIATGNAPDLVLASQEDLQSLSKLLAPIPLSMLSEPTFNTTFVEEGRLFAAPNGAGYYGVPFFVDPLVLFSNNAILSSSGIAKPPTTWEALTGLVPNIALLTPTKQITRGLIALGTYDNIHNARAILSSLFIQTGVPISSRTSDAISANLSGISSAGMLPGKAVLSFYTQFADPSKVSYTWNAALPDSQQAFQNGDLAMYLGYASEAQFFTAANPNLNFNVSAIPQPATASLKSAYGLVYALMIPRGAKNASGAYQALLLFSSSAIAAVAPTAAGLAPANLSQLATQPADPVAAVAYAEALYTSGWLSPMPADTDPVFSSMITGVISGHLTPDSALTIGGNALSSLLQK
jgi:ABC-type glycerol-3-phosphate transport system substrate-binding protein